MRLICGGFPCQDLSVAGKGAGLSGERSGLWFEFLRILEEYRPEWCVIENVPGLLSSHGGRDFAIVLQGLVKLGYSVAWRVLDAQYYRVAQRRRRVFIVGCLREGRAAEVLFEPEGRQRYTAPSREKREGVARDAQGSIGIDSEQNADRELIGTLRSHRSGGAESAVAIDAHNLAGSEISGTLQAKESGYSLNFINPVAYRMSAFGQYEDDDTASSLKKRDYKDATDLVAYGVQTANSNMGGPIHKEEQAWSVQPHTTRTAVAFTERTRPDGRNLETQDELAYALTNPGSGGRTHSRSIAGPFGVRRLTPTECERLQGFPDGWTLVRRGKKVGRKNIARDLFEYLERQFKRVFGRRFSDPDEFRTLASDSQRYRQLGNAVCVPVIEWIGRRIMMVERRDCGQTPAPSGVHTQEARHAGAD